MNCRDSSGPLHLPTLTITRLIRRMRGGSQSQLVEASNGKIYIAKFLGNPQGNRTLINEVIAYQILRDLGISPPPLCRLQLPENPNIREQAYFIIGSRRIPVQTGHHLGSMCPVNPDGVAVLRFPAGAPSQPSGQYRRICYDVRLRPMAIQHGQAASRFLLGSHLFGQIYVCSSFHRSWDDLQWHPLAIR